MALDRGICPHCATGVLFEALPMLAFQEPQTGEWHPAWQAHLTITNEEWLITARRCPACGEPVLSIQKPVCQSRDEEFRPPILLGYEDEVLLWPRGSGRSPVSDSVPAAIRSDYEEAAMVLPFSPKASAALSRRCLQAVLRDAGGSAKTKLVSQIADVKDKLPAHIWEQLDLVRETGNFAAHPEKDLASGAIIEVEPDEGSCNLDVLDLLFEHYYAQPARVANLTERVRAKRRSTRLEGAS